MEVGDLVKFMSRTLLVIDIDETWVHGVELGESIVGKYRKSEVRALKPSQSGDDECLI